MSVARLSVRSSGRGRGVAISSFTQTAFRTAFLNFSDSGVLRQLDRRCLTFERRVIRAQPGTSLTLISLVGPALDVVRLRRWVACRELLLLLQR